MYAGCNISVMTSAGKTKGIEIEVGLLQGSALSPLLFVIIIYVITKEIEEGTPWAMLFADDLALCDPDRKMMELRDGENVWKRMGLKSVERKPNTYKQQGTLVRLG